MAPNKDDENGVNSFVSANGSIRLIKRPDSGGKAGRKIELEANHFRFTLGKQLIVHQYDVEISRFAADGKARNTTRDQAHLIFWVAVKTNAGVFGDPELIVYDCRKTMFSMKTIDDCSVNKPLVLQFPSTLLNDREREVRCRVKIQYACDVDVSKIRQVYHEELGEREMSQIRFLDLLFRQGRHFNDSLVPAGRSFYFRSHDNDRLDLGCGRELLKGFYLSSRIIDNWQLSLNFNWNATAFYENDNAVVFAAKFLCYLFKKPYSATMPFPSDLPQRELALLEKEFKGCPPRDPGVKVLVKQICQTFTPSGLGPATARTQSFSWVDKNGNHGVVTVLQYYQQKYGVTLRYPDWPLFLRGKGQKISFYPMEVCEIAPGQRVKNRKIDENQHSIMIKRTAVTPFERRQKILHMLKQARFVDDPRLRKFYVSISMEMAQLCGRVLTPPMLQYNSGSETVQPANGCWTANRLYKGAELVNWAFVSYAQTSDKEIMEFARLLYDEARRMGLHVEAPCTRVWRGTDVAGVTSTLHQVEQAFAMRQLDLQLIVVVMSGKNTELYAEIKRVSESDLGVMTQCLQNDRLRQASCRAPDGGKKGRQALANIVLKLNAKLGGINVQIDPRDAIAQKYLFTPILFMGADVNHPDPGDTKSPSIAAVCSNADNHPNQYVGFEMIQRSRLEILDDLKKAVKHSLFSYYRNTRLKPDKIIFYRDGVSEGQFKEVLNKELSAIQTACMEIDQTYKPAITFIIVQKRHNTRFFKKHINERDRPNMQNIPAGTVVDSVVTHPAEFDFFLCSHQGIQGTSKPTHYHVLFDQTGFTSDELQALTYHLCHTYARCTRSVSLPTPCYYAHLIAYRAKLRLNRHMDGETASRASSSSDSSGLTDSELLRLQQLNSLNVAIEKSMYWQ